MATQGRTWVDVQKKTFTGWANNYLKERIMRIKDIEQDLADGVLLINLLEIISHKKLPKYTSPAKSRFQKIENNVLAIKFIQNEGLKLVGIGAEDLADGKLKLTLGLIWTLILRYQISTIDADGFESPKAALLAWVRQRIAPYRVPVHDFDSSWQDGRALAALTDSVEPGTIPLNTLSNDPFTDVNRAMDLAQEKFDIPKIMDPQDLVSIPDDLSVMTYISYFRDYIANRDKLLEERQKQEEFRRRNTADPTHTYAQGPGVEPEGVYAHDSAQFVIHAHNFYDEPLKAGGETFSVEVVGKESTAAGVMDKNDGTYSVAYLPTTPDHYEVHVTLNGVHIKGSPYHVHVDGADPNHTIAQGPGLTQGHAHVHKPAVFTIHAHDSKNAPIPRGGDTFEVHVRSAHGAEVPAEVADHGDGSYTVTYHPTTSGAHHTVVLLRGHHISGAPYSTIVYAGTPENSYAEGPGLEDSKASHPAHFTIHSVDVDGNKVHTGGEPFEVHAHGPHGPVEAHLQDNHDGTYSASYTPTAPGHYDIQVSIHGVPLNGFPKKLHAKPSANASQTLVEGPGIVAGQAERPAKFTIHARDADGHPRTDGGDNFHVHVDNVEGKVVDNGDGTYDVTYEVSLPGDYHVQVLLDDNKPVAHSPYSVHIKPAPSAKNSYAEGPGLTHPTDNAPAIFTIHAVDPTGAPRTDGGDPFEVFVHPAHHVASSVPARVTDNNDGTYTVEYNPEEPGEYVVDVRVGGVDIRDTPVHVTVREGTDAALSGFGSFSFTIAARDKRGNPKTFGGDPFEVIIKGPAENVEVKAIDNGDGSYTATYVIEGTGRFLVTVKLNGKEVAGSPFVQNVGSVKKDKHGQTPVHETVARANF